MSHIKTCTLCNKKYLGIDDTNDDICRGCLTPSFAAVGVTPVEFCDHPNEVPNVCPCPPNCYCRGEGCTCDGAGNMPEADFSKETWKRDNKYARLYKNNSGCSVDGECKQCRRLEAAPVIPVSRVDSNSQPQSERNGLPYIKDLVIKDMQDRAEFGNKKYGTYLQAYNGRDVLVDIYQELMDAVQYVRQLMYERDGK